MGFWERERAHLLLTDSGSGTYEICDDFFEFSGNNKREPCGLLDTGSSGNSIDWRSLDYLIKSNRAKILKIGNSQNYARMIDGSVKKIELYVVGPFYFDGCEIPYVPFFYFERNKRLVFGDRFLKTLEVQVSLVDGEISYKCPN